MSEMDIILCKSLDEFLCRCSDTLNIWMCHLSMPVKYENSNEYKNFREFLLLTSYSHGEVIKFEQDCSAINYPPSYFTELLLLEGHHIVDGEINEEKIRIAYSHTHRKNLYVKGMLKGKCVRSLK